MTKIIIAAEVQGPLNDAAFLAMGRLGQTRQRPGYTVLADGEVLAIRDSIDDAEDFAVYYRDMVLLGDAIVVYA